MAERFCKKCGYSGPDQLHQRPNGTGQCGYLFMPAAESAMHEEKVAYGHRTFGRLVKAAINLIAEVQQNHETKAPPLKYTVPYGAVVALQEALTAIPEAAAPPPAGAQQAVAPEPVPDSVWEALQRMIEDGLVKGPASQEDARTVMRYRDRVRFLAAPAAAQKTPKPAGYWVRLVREDGSSAWWHSSLRPDRHSAELIAKQWKEQLVCLIGGAGGLQIAIDPIYLAAIPAPEAAPSAKEGEAVQQMGNKINRYCRAGMCVATDEEHEPECQRAWMRLKGLTPAGGDR